MSNSKKLSTMLKFSMSSKRARAAQKRHENNRLKDPAEKETWDTTRARRETDLAELLAKHDAEVRAVFGPLGGRHEFVKDAKVDAAFEQHRDSWGMWGAELHDAWYEPETGIYWQQMSTTSPHFVLL